MPIAKLRGLQITAQDTYQIEFSSAGVRRTKMPPRVIGSPTPSRWVSGGAMNVSKHETLNKQLQASLAFQRLAAKRRALARQRNIARRQAFAPPARSDKQSLLTKRSSAHQRFSRYVSQWKGDTKYSSSIRAVTMHPAYQHIIGMGPEAIPLILRELSREPDHWFWALYAITGQDPARNTTTIEEAATAWLNWGRKHGYNW